MPPMPSPIRECAETLSRLYSERAQGQIALNHLEAGLNIRQLTLTPADGWPGKNAETRQQAQELALLSDADYQTIGKQISAARDALSKLEATIDGVKETASALRWEIRAALVAALDKRYIEPSDDADPSAPEFDSAAQQETDDIPF